MSGEPADPGGNHPDRDAAPPAPSGATQDEPVMELNDATVEERLDGIVAQTRVDVGDQSAERIADVLRQRLHDAGIELDDAGVGRLAARAQR